MTAALHNAEFLKSAELKSLLTVLNAKQETTRIVGGAVRNALMGLEVSDIDLATVLKPDEVQALCTRAGFQVIPTGIEFGTVTVLVGNKKFEVTSLRQDLSTDGRHATVAFGTSWVDDAARRDFTINALYCDIEGNIFDPFAGNEDIKSRRVRFIGDASKRICEDLLRVWRFFRFSAQFTKNHFDPDGLAACFAARDQLHTLSAERVRQELFKILETDQASKTLSVMASGGLLVFLKVCRTNLLQKLIEFESAHHFKANILLRLLVLCIFTEDQVERLAHQLRLSRDEKKYLYRLAHLMVFLKEKPVQAELNKLHYQFSDVFIDALRFAAILNQDSLNIWLDYIRDYEQRPVPEFLVTGQDLIDLGYQSGKELGQKLQELEKNWIESDFKLNKEALLKQL